MLLNLAVAAVWSLVVYGALYWLCGGFQRPRKRGGILSPPHRKL